MNGTQLTWIVLLTFTFIVAILTTPLSTITNCEKETTVGTIQTFKQKNLQVIYCMNGGSCHYLEEQQTVACECPDLYGGKRCEKYLWYT